jgi:hypothetical protein
MMTSSSCPFAHDPREVPDVEGDHDAVLVGGEREKPLIVPAVQRPFLVGRPHVVSTFAERLGDDPPREVGVKEEPHAVLPGNDRVEGWIRYSAISGGTRAWAPLRGYRAVDEVGGARWAPDTTSTGR